MEKVSRLLNCIDNLKHRVMLKTIYSAGFKVGEAIRLKPEHIESDPSRMVIRVEPGKGRKDRYTLLSEHLLHELRAYWLEYAPKYWLFPGQKPGTHITNVSVSQVLNDAKKIGLTKECSLHTLRHSFATHLLYKGYDLYTTSQLLGHNTIETTTIYLRLVPARYVQLKSPLDLMDEQQEGQDER